MIAALHTHQTTASHREIDVLSVAVQNRRMTKNTISVVLRYGALLAVFLIATETAKRSYINDLSSLDLYIGSIALLFLVLGGLIAYRLHTTTAPDEAAQTEVRSVVKTDDFSQREADVLLYLCHGYPNSEIAEQLGISLNTVKTHLKNIYGKLGVTNRTQAAAEAKLLKIIN